MPLPLTDMYDTISEKGLRETPPGMAHWRGSGPKGKVCRECIHYRADRRYTANSPGHAKNQLMPGDCRKVKALTNLWGPKFPTETAACKHFEENPEPPPFILKGGLK